MTPGGASSSSGKTRILFLNSPDRPGADTAIQLLLMRSLDRSAFELHAACTAGARGSRTATWEALAQVPDLHLRTANFGPSLSGRSAGAKVLATLGAGPALASLLGLAAYVRRRGIQVVHSSDRPRDAVACAFLSALTGAKALVHVHVRCGPWMSRAVRWAMRRADALVGVSRFVAGTLVENGYPPGKIYAVLNAIDASRWDYRLDGSGVRRELEIPASAPVLLSVSRLFHWKGHGDLLRAFARVHREFPEARLLIVGDDDPAGIAGEPFSAQLKATARELGVAGRVLFTGFRSDVPRLLAAADVYSMPSFEEPFGLVFLEAMAMKRPVVALDSGGTPEVVEHGKSGLLSPPGEVGALAENLRSLLRAPEMRARMGEYGRRQVEERFNPQRMASDAARVYSSVRDSC